MLKYTDSHEWIRIEEDGLATVGISEYARDELGEIVYVELPALQTQVNQGEEVVVLESTKAAADMYAPVSGSIIAINEDLKENPELLNESPEDKGWLFKIKINNPQEISSLLKKDEYLQLIHN